MTRERIEGMREVILPFVKKRLLETNYEGLGKSDAEEFTRDFNEILDLATKALEQEPNLDKIREEIKVMTSNRGFLSCSVGYIHKEIDNVFDKYKTEIEP